MIIKGIQVDKEVLNMHKSISENLRNSNVFESVNEDTAGNVIELKPPIPMSTCFYIFRESSHVAECSRILADDLIYNTITLTPSIKDPSEELINQVTIINKYLNKNIDEFHNLIIDYYYAGWAVMEYAWNNTEFKLQQIPVHTCSIIRVNENGASYYLLQQRINSETHYFKIMGEEYPENFQFYNGHQLSDVSILGGDNVYQFFSLPRWIQNYDEILTEIAIKKSDYKTVANGNINSGVLNINLEPQIAPPRKVDEKGNVIVEKTREEVISDELQSARGGTAVIFTESNRPTNMDYVSLTNNNHDYLSDLKINCRESVLNNYGIPLARLMINTEKESMNSDKTKSIWEIYTTNLDNKQKLPKQFINELIYDLYSIEVDVDIALPIFSDRRETEIKLHSTAWNDGALTLKQYVTALADLLPVVDLNDYDFNKNPEIWMYRKIPELTNNLSPDELAMIDEIEASLNATKT